MVGFKSRRLIGLSIIVMGLGFFFRLGSQAIEDQPRPAEAGIDELIAPINTRQSQASPAATKATLPSSSSASPDVSTPAPSAPPQLNVSPIATSSVVPRPAFDALPLESQSEIRAFASRDNSDLVIEQVSPTLFRASLLGIHQAVPVATIGADGQVTINEY